MIWSLRKFWICLWSQAVCSLKKHVLVFFHVLSILLFDCSKLHCSFLHPLVYIWSLWQYLGRTTNCENTHYMIFFSVYFFLIGGTRWRSWLRYCATNRKVVGSIPNGAIGIFHWHNPSGHTLALGLTQPLTEVSTRNISWGGKGGRCIGLTTLPPSCADCLEIWELQPPGTLRASPGL
jgi:hypothetical protein